MKILNKISWVQAQVVSLLVIFITIIAIWTFFGDHRPRVSVTRTLEYNEIVFLALEPIEFNRENYKKLHPDDKITPSDIRDEGRTSFIIISKNEPDPKFFKEVK